MANSDIIKIGFDYRASLAQFEKDTNGVFDGISNKAGKQKITIQLDAKDDKVIDKIKELQKLKLDKFTFEFGDSGLKEQLQTFDKLESKINEIINLSKGINNNLGQINNGNALKAELDLYHMTEKRKVSYDEIINKIQSIISLQEKSQKLESKKSLDGKYYQEIFDENINWVEKEKTLENISLRLKEIYSNSQGKITLISNDDIKEAAYLLDMLKGAGEALDNLTAKELKFFSNKKFENKDLFNFVDNDNSISEQIEKIQIKLSNLYKWFEKFEGVSLNPNIKSDIDRLVSEMEVGEKEASEYANELLKIFNIRNTSPNISVNNISQIDKLENKISELTQKYKELQNKTTEVSGKDLNLVDNEEFKKLSQEVSELKNQFDNLKTHMHLLDDYTVPTDRFFKLQSQVEATTVKVSDLVDEFTKLSNAQKALSSTPQESNISLTSDTVEQQIKSESELNAEIEKRENIIRELQQLQEKLTVHEDFHGNDRYFADQLPTEEEIREADKRIKQLTGTNNIFNVDKLIQDRNEWLSEVKYSLEEYDDLIKANDQKALDEYTTRGLSRIGGAESFFGYEDNNFSIASKFVEEKEKIQNEINDLYTDLDKLDEKMNLDSNNSSVDNTVQSQEKLQSELKETQKQAEKTAQAVKESTTTASTEQKKDAFPNANTKLDEVVTSAKDLDKTLEQVDIPTDSFDKVLEKLDRTKSELVDIVKITKQSVSDADGKFHDSYTLKDSRGSTEIYGVNSKTDKGQILRQNIVGYDKKKDELDISKAQLEVDKQLAKEEDNLTKAQQKKAQAFLKEQANYEEDQKKAELIKRQTLAYEELTDTISKYSEVAKRVAGGNAEDGDLELMTKLEDKISQLQKQPILSDSQVSKSEKSLVSLYDQLDKIERKLVETNQKSQDKQIAGFDKRLESYTKKTSGYNATIARFNDGGWTSDTYLKNVQAVKDAVHEYKNLLDNIKTNQNGIATDEDIQNLDEYEKKIKDTIATVTNMSAAEKGYSQLAGQKEIDKINKILRENSAMSSEAKAKIKAYKQELISGNPSVSLEKIHGEIMKIVNAEELAGRAGRSMFDVIKEKAFYGFAAQIGMYFGFNDIVNGFKQVASTIRELDTAYTEMRKVSDESAQSLKNFQKESFSTADSVGTTALAMQDATATWMRLGESLDDAKESAKDATVLLNVSEFDNIDEATDSLVAMSQAYKDLDKMEIIDVLDKIGNEYSISTDQLSTALKDSAAVLKTQGNDLAESVALITAGKVITCIYRNIYNRMNLIAGNA